jgi:hypothetical protein
MPLNVNISKFRCRNGNVFNYGVLPHTALRMLRHIRYANRVFSLQNLKSSEFRNTSGPKSFGQGIVDLY